MKVYCVSSLESPHPGDSNEYTQYTIFNIKKKKNTIFNMKKRKKNIPNYPKSAVMVFFSNRLKNEFETAVVNELSVFESLKFYCTWSKYPRPKYELVKH